MSDWHEIERLIEEGRQQAVEGPLTDDADLWQSVANYTLLADFPDPNDIAKEVLTRFFAALGTHPLPAQEITSLFVEIAADLWRTEALHQIPPTPPEGGTLLEIGTWRDELLAMRARVQDPDRTQEAFITCLVKAFVYISRRLPEIAHYQEPEPAPFTVQLTDYMASLPDVTEDMRTVFDTPEPKALHLFTRLEENPFDRLLNVELPFDIPMQTRGEHTAIVAGSGHGKTQLLQTITATDLEREDPPGLIVLDSTGAMTDAIQRLACFSDRLQDRILILDPKDDPAPALNLLDLNTARYQQYSRRERQALENEIVNLFGYVFSSAGTPLTQLMSGPFAYAVQLALSIPNATLDTLKSILEDKARTFETSLHRSHVEQLDYETYKPIVDYFRNRYYSQSADRRNQIADRIDMVLKNTVIAEMLNAKVHKVDFFDAMNRGATILVNTSQEILHDDSTFFGRYVIARVMAAAFERASLPRSKRKQCFLVVDEAAPYFDDEQFPKLLTRVRQYGLGAVVAFQDLGQATQKLQSAIASSTAVKFAGGLGHDDARWLGREMRRDTDFLLAHQRQPGRRPKWTEFACYARGLTTDGAISLTIPFGTLERMEQMSEADHAELLERNRQRVAASYERRMPPPPTPAPAPPIATESADTPHRPRRASAKDSF